MVWAFACLHRLISADKRNKHFATPSSEHVLVIHLLSGRAIIYLLATCRPVIDFGWLYFTSYIWNIHKWNKWMNGICVMYTLGLIYCNSPVIGHTLKSKPIKDVREKKERKGRQRNKNFPACFSQRWERSVEIWGYRFHNRVATGLHVSVMHFFVVILWSWSYTLRT